MTLEVRRISLLALDVDGTLVTDADQVLPGTRAAVHRAGREGLAVVVVVGTPSWYLETILGGVDKWVSVRRFAAAKGIGEDAICAVDDADNDLRMIRGAAVGVAMGNADPVVKQVADWITDSNEENGIASLVDSTSRSA